jgi:hypothetical protein
MNVWRVGYWPGSICRPGLMGWAGIGDAADVTREGWALLGFIIPAREMFRVRKV